MALAGLGVGLGSSGILLSLETRLKDAVMDCWCDWTDYAVPLRRVHDKIASMRRGALARRVLEGWTREAATRALWRRRLRRCRAVAFRRLLSRWRELTIAKRELASSLEGQLAMQRTRCMRKCIHLWTGVVDQRMAREYSIAMHMNRSKMSLLASTLLRWDDAASLSASLRHAGQVIAARSCLRIMTCALDEWSDIAYDRRRHRHALERALKSLKATVGNAHSQTALWSSLVGMTRSSKGLCSARLPVPSLLLKHASKSVSRPLRASLAAWAAVASLKAYCRHCVERSQQRSVGRLCCAVVDAWVEVVEVEAHVKALCTQARWRADMRLVRGAVRGWRGVIEAKVHHAALLARGLARSHVRRMAKLLWGWRSYVDECNDERLMMTRLWRRTVVDGAGG